MYGTLAGAPRERSVQADRADVEVPSWRLARLLLVAGLTGCGYLAAIVVFTWPLAGNLRGLLPEIFPILISDLYYAVWALAWQTHALTSPAAFAQANIYAPARDALFYGTPGFGLLPVFAPVFLLSRNPALAANVTLLLNLALTATTIHLVVRSWTRSDLAAIAAALTFLGSRTALVQCGTMPQYAALAATPLMIWLLARGTRTWRGTAALAALIVVQCLTDVVYVALPVFASVGLAACVRAARPHTRSDAFRVLAALVIAIAALAPIYMGYLAVRGTNPDLSKQSVWHGTALVFNFDAGFWIPWRGGPLALYRPTMIPVILGAVAAWWIRRRDGRLAAGDAWWQSALWFLTALTMSWLVPVHLPAFREFAFHTFLRDFMRLGMTGLIAFCLLVGLGFAACARLATDRLPRGVRTAVAATLLVMFVVGGQQPRPWPLGAYPVKAPPDAALETTLLRAGEGPVLDLPMGDPKIDTISHARAMYRSIAHWRPLVNGYSSYYPAGFRDRLELARKLPDRTALETLRRDTGLTTIVVHLTGLPFIVPRWMDALKHADSGLRARYIDTDLLMIEVTLP